MSVARSVFRDVRGLIAVFPGEQTRSANMGTKFEGFEGQS